MSHYLFSQEERYAVFIAHGPKCYLCLKPIDLQTMHIDHIIPEHLSKNPDLLKKILKDYGKESSFNLNSYENWLPACARCNGYKRGSVFKPVPIMLFQLSEAASKADFARLQEAKTFSNISLGRAIGVICRASANTQLEMRHVEIIINNIREYAPDLLKEALGQGSGKNIPVSIPLTPYHTIVMESYYNYYVKTPLGVGYVPKGDSIDHSFYCGNCGKLGPWSGARCLSCGELNDD